MSGEGGNIILQFLDKDSLEENHRKMQNVKESLLIMKAGFEKEVA